METTGIGEVFDRAAGGYERTGVAFFGPLGERLVAGMRLRPGARVLDIGCGKGACTVPVARAVGPRGSVVGVDASAAMLEGLRVVVVAEALDNVTLVEGDARRPDFEPESFDAVVAGLVLFMLPDPAAALRVYHGLLRPGGTFGMSTFGADDPRFFDVTNAVLPYLDGPMPPVPGRDGPLRTHEGIRRLLGAAGFSDVQVDDGYLDLEFDTPGRWWDWLWQTAGRMVLERIPADRMPDARAAAASRMEAVRAERGRYVIHWNVWNAFAVRR